MFALAIKGDVKELDTRLDGSAPVDEQDAEGFTPLTRAAQNGHKAAVEFLITRRANANHTTKLGEFPLQQAAHAGHKDVCEALLKAGADKSKKYVGWSASQWASAQRQEDLAAFIDSWGQVCAVLVRVI